MTIICPYILAINSFLFFFFCTNKSNYLCHALYTVAENLSVALKFVLHNFGITGMAVV